MSFDAGIFRRGTSCPRSDACSPCSSRKSATAICGQFAPPVSIHTVGRNFSSSGRIARSSSPPHNLDVAFDEGVDALQLAEQFAAAAHAALGRELPAAFPPPSHIDEDSAHAEVTVSLAGVTLAMTIRLVLSPEA